MALITEEELTMSLLDTIDTNDECLLELCDAFQQISEDQLDDLLKDVDVDSLELLQDTPELTLEEVTKLLELEEPQKNQEPIEMTTHTDAVENIILTLDWSKENFKKPSGEHSKSNREAVEKRTEELEVLHMKNLIKTSQEYSNPIQIPVLKKITSKLECTTKQSSQKRKLGDAEILEEFLTLPKSPCSSPGSTKRKRFRNSFTPDQLDILHEEFALSEYCNTSRAISIAKKTFLPANTVKFWFQNQRSKKKKKKNPPAPSPRKPKKIVPPTDPSKTYVLHNGAYVRADTLMQSKLD